MNRFSGGCEPLAEINVTDLIAWISTIPRGDGWPDWFKQASRPAVIADGRWQDLQGHTERVVGELMQHFPGCIDTARSITTIHPGDYVPPHTDICLQEWISRVHVPIVTNLGCFFIDHDDVRHHMEVGMAYQVNPSKPHSVVNGGQNTRIHLMFDVLQ